MELIRVNQEGAVIEKTFTVPSVAKLIEDADIAQINCRFGVFDVSKRELAARINGRTDRIERVTLMQDYTTGKTICRVSEAAYR
jgi:hypothetical protein